MMPTPFRTWSTAILAGAVLAVAAPAASAHVQLSPAVAAPNDPILVTVLVPNERPESTVKVSLKVPKGVLPFSFGDSPGWKRTMVEASDGSTDQIVWTGKLASDGLARFEFLAGTPETAGKLEWKALQEYEGGQIDRWIGAEGSENPAPVMTISEDAPRQNAGGEGGGAESSADNSASASKPTGSGSSDSNASEDNTDWVTRGIAIAALLVAIAGLGAALGSARRAKG